MLGCYFINGLLVLSMSLYITCIINVFLHCLTPFEKHTVHIKLTV